MKIILLRLLVLVLSFPPLVFADFPLIGAVFPAKMPDGHFARTSSGTTEKQVEGSFQGGKKTGFWVYYYAGGKKMEEGNYKDDKREGLWTAWYSNGALSAKGNFAGDKQTGFWISKSPDGSRREEGNFEDGQKIGVWHSWYPNGQMGSEGAYDHGVQTGWWSNWYSNGILQSKTQRGSRPEITASPEPKKQKFYNEEGNLIDYESWVPPDLDLLDIKEVTGPKCRFFTLTTQEMNRLYYIQRPSDPKPFYYFQNERSMNPILGNKGRLVLIDSVPATRSSDILIADLNTGKNWPIDEKVKKRYEKNKDGQGFSSLPWTVKFSPDDWTVLLYMMVEERYVEVDSKSGKILNDYAKNKVPSRWGSLANINITHAGHSVVP